jgi:hypothetical protein
MRATRLSVANYNTMVLSDSLKAVPAVRVQVSCAAFFGRVARLTCHLIYSLH